MRCWPPGLCLLGPLALALAPLGAAAQPAAQTSTACSIAPSAPSRAPAATTHGIEEIHESTIFEIPPQFASLNVELWGGGGGGGAGSDESFSEGGAGGGGGASGGYTRASLSVSPGSRLVLLVGAGGHGGVVGSKGPGRTSNGQSGSDSFVCQGDSVLLTAPGGRGGTGPATNSKGGVGGSERTEAPQRGSASALYRSGGSGGQGAAPLFEYRGWGGKGGRPPAGTVEPAAAFGGSGGSGAMRPEPATDGETGGSGSIIVSW